MEISNQLLPIVTMRKFFFFLIVLMLYTWAGSALVVGRTRLTWFRRAQYCLKAGLTVGEFDNIVIEQVDSLGSPEFGKYRLKGMIDRKTMSGYLKDYKEEMKRKKIMARGFRPGVVPPHAMPEIRSFLVGHAMETVLGEVCNMNGLRVSVTC